MAVDKEQYEEFQKIKFEKDPLVILDKKAQLHLYEIYKEPNTASGSKILGTAHDLPIDILPDVFFKHFKEADEIYMEGESLLHLAFLKSAESQFSIALDKTALEIYEESHLSNLLKVFNPDALKIRDLTLEQLYSIVCIGDCFLGMDSEITLRALYQKKPVYMLDEPWDLFAKGIEVHESYLNPEVRLKYLDSQKCFSRELLVKAFMEEDGLEYMKFNIVSRNAILAEYSLEDIQEEAPEDEEAPLEINKRNERWFQILDKSDLAKRKLCCVGIDHLNGLFKLFKSSGYSIKDLGQD
jgi:hypothetical protein